MNYLLDKLGEAPSRTVGILDMGGGSVQQAYATLAPTSGSEAGKYITQVKAMGKQYNVYVYRYGYRDGGSVGGLMAWLE